MYDEIRRTRKQNGREGMANDLFVWSEKKYSPNSIVFVPRLVCWTERFPLAVQIIFQKKQMLRALCEFLKFRGVVLNSKTLDTGAERRLKLR